MTIDRMACPWTLDVTIFKQGSEAAHKQTIEFDAALKQMIADAKVERKPMSKITGSAIGPEVVEALNLGRGVKSVDVHIATNELVTVTVVRHVEDHEARALLKVLSRYVLSEVESATEPARQSECNGVDEQLVRVSAYAHQRPEPFDDVSGYPFKVRMPDGSIKEFDNHRERTMWLAQWERSDANSTT